MAEFHPSTKLSSRGGSNYEPLEISDKSVYELAKVGMTVREIGRMFKLSDQVFLDKFGESFRLGQGQLKAKPRLVLQRLIDKLVENMEAGPIDDCKTTNHLLNAIAQMDKYIPKDAVEESKADDLTTDEIAARIAALIKR